MIAAGVLDRLEAQVASLPAGAAKDDMDAGFDAMARWIEELSGHERAEVVAALPRWLVDNHPWHDRAVSEIALRLRSVVLLNAAIAHAWTVGVHPVASAHEYPPWLTYQLNLLSVLSRWPGKPGVEAHRYLEHLRKLGLHESTYGARLLGIRAWFTQCLLDTPSERERCLDPALTALRSWRDRRLRRSALALLHAYFAASSDDVAALKRLLTPDEFAMAFPERGLS